MTPKFTPAKSFLRVTKADVGEELVDSSHHGRMGLTFFDEVRVLIFLHYNRVRFISLTEVVIYVFGVFISIRGGTPDKRIPEGLL